MLHGHGQLQLSGQDHQLGKRPLALPTEMDSEGLAIMRQIMKERHVQVVIVSGVETRL